VAKSRPYIIQLRVGVTAESDLLADKIADNLSARVEEFLDDGDTSRVMQVVCLGEPLRMEEQITRLKIARNELIRLRYKDTMSMAQSLDQVIWKLMKQVTDDEALPNDYNYNRIVEIAEALDRGENPLY